jgi:hypothetical protein
VNKADKLKEGPIKLDDSDLVLRIGDFKVLYREAVMTSSPTLPLGATLGRRG